MQLIIHNKAKDDIKHIYLYSFDQFGERQADIYYDGLSQRMAAITTGEVASSDYSHIKKGLRRTNYESHAIYYRIENGTVIIIRVLGQSQDTPRHII